MKGVPQNLQTAASCRGSTSIVAPHWVQIAGVRLMTLLSFIIFNSPIRHQFDSFTSSSITIIKVTFYYWIAFYKSWGILIASINHNSTSGCSNNHDAGHK